MVNTPPGEKIWFSTLSFTDIMDTDRNTRRNEGGVTYIEAQKDKTSKQATQSEQTTAPHNTIAP